MCYGFAPVQGTSSVCYGFAPAQGTFSSIGAFLERLCQRVCDMKGAKCAGSCSAGPGGGDRVSFRAQGLLIWLHNTAGGGITHKGRTYLLSCSACFSGLVGLAVSALYPVLRAWCKQGLLVKALLEVCAW